MKLKTLLLSGALLLIVASASAFCCRPYIVSQTSYYDHPYYWSNGPRYTPYWSYNSSYFPCLYDGDGSYYGLGYSGAPGNGWQGTYWYW